MRVLGTLTNFEGELLDLSPKKCESSQEISPMTVRKNVSLKELSFGYGNDSTLSVGPIGEFFKELAYREYIFFHGSLG